MKVGIISPYAYPRPGGANSYIRESYEELRRLGHEVRPTAPFTDEGWDALQKAGAATDEKLRALGIALTCGGEPTFNSRLHGELPEWNTEALGATKWEQGLALARELRERLVPGGVLLLRQGKQYPGESLPRWTLELIGRSTSYFGHKVIAEVRRLCRARRAVRWSKHVNDQTRTGPIANAVSPFIHL